MSWQLLDSSELNVYKERTGLSWAAIGAQLGVTHGAIYCWRVGRTTPPLETQQRMVELFGLRKVEDEPVDELADALVAHYYVDLPGLVGIERLIIALHAGTKGEGHA